MVACKDQTRVQIVKFWPNSTNAKRPKKRYHCPQVDCLASCSRTSDLQRHLRTGHHEQGDVDFRCFVLGCQMRHARKGKVKLHRQRVRPGAKIGSFIGVAVISSNVPAQKSSNTAADEPKSTVQSVQTSTHPNQHDTAAATAKSHVSDSQTDAVHQRQYHVDRGESQDACANGSVWPASSNLEISAAIPPAATQVSHATNNPIISGPSPRTNGEAGVVSALNNFERHFQGHSPKRASSTPPRLLRTHLNSSLATVGTGFDRTDNPHILGISIRHPSTAPPLGSDHSPCDGDHGQSTSRVGGNILERGSSNTSELTGSNRQILRHDGTTGKPQDVRRQGKRRKLNIHDDPMLFACIGHHREHRPLDAFAECESTRKQHFSQLERHHSRHGWFYCTRCLTTFDNVDERKVHKDSAKCAFKCATTHCPEYGTFPPVKCAHAHGYSDSGEVVWQYLFRIYRPEDVVPNPRIRGDLATCHSTTSAETPLQDVSSPPMSPSRRDAPFPEPRGDQMTPPTANTPRIIEPFSLTSTRTRVLITLAALLWQQVSTQNPTPSNWVRRLYELAMEAPRRPAENIEADHAALVLEHFVHQLWRVANREIEMTAALYNELQTFARLWLPSTDTTTLQPTLLDMADGLSFARADPAPFDGVGDQFREILPGTDTILTQQHMNDRTKRDDVISIRTRSISSTRRIDQSNPIIDTSPQCETEEVASIEGFRDPSPAASTKDEQSTALASSWRPVEQSHAGTNLGTSKLAESRSPSLGGRADQVSVGSGAARRNSSGSGTHRSGPIHHNRSGKHDSHSSYDGASTAPRITTPQFPNSEFRGFPCVFHHPDIPENDHTLDCRTRHRFVSELRVHHGGNAHQFFYCPECFKMFANKEQRYAHDPKHCRDFKCVTEGCSNYNTFMVSSCNHPGRKNSQIAVWKALFKLVRSSDSVPSVIDVGDGALTSTRELLTPAIPTIHTPAQSDFSSPAKANKRSVSSSQVVTPQTATTWSSLDPDAGIDSYAQALQTLAFGLLKHLETPDPESLDIVEEMYTSYIDSNSASSSEHYTSRRLPAVVNGLKTLCKAMREVVRDPEGASLTRKNQLRDWAYGILPQRTDSTRPVYGPSSKHLHHQYAEKTTPAHAGTSNSRFVLTESHLPPYTDTSVQRLDAAWHNTLEPESVLLDYDFDTDFNHSSFVEQIPRADFSQPAPSYMPFTHEDSLVAVLQDRRDLRKASARDSAYGSGSVNNTD